MTVSPDDESFGNVPTKRDKIPHFLISQICVITQKGYVLNRVKAHYEGGWRKYEVALRHYFTLFRM
jgi:hypothetical protein